LVWQHDGEARTRPLAAIDLNSAAVLRHNLLHQRETNSGAFLTSALTAPYPIESLKYLPLLGGRDSVSLIDD
jgi:hypothetical protein